MATIINQSISNSITYASNHRINQSTNHHNHQSAIINHQSTVDLLLLAYILQPRVVMTAKKEVASIPLLGQVFTAGTAKKRQFYSNVVTKKRIESI